MRFSTSEDESETFRDKFASKITKVDGMVSIASMDLKWLDDKFFWYRMPLAEAYIHFFGKI